MSNIEFISYVSGGGPAWQEMVQRFGLLVQGIGVDTDLPFNINVRAARDENASLSIELYGNVFTFEVPAFAILWPILHGYYVGICMQRTMKPKAVEELVELGRREIDRMPANRLSGL